MGVDKALIEIDGLPLWRRQVAVLRELQPDELFIAGPSRDEWCDNGAIVIPDAQPDAGPLAGLIAALRRCSNSHLLTLAVDLPHMTADYLNRLLRSCCNRAGIIPMRQRHFEPLAAVYPQEALSLAESCLASGDHSLQNFAARCVSDRLAAAIEIPPSDEPLFLNMNTPADLLAVTNA